jgi:hypothetical protein
LFEARSILTISAPAPDGERIAVEIHDLTIANGLAGDAPGFPTSDPFNFPALGWGGGIYNRGSDVSLESVKLIGTIERARKALSLPPGEPLPTNSVER